MKMRIKLPVKIINDPTAKPLEISMPGVFRIPKIGPLKNENDSNIKAAPSSVKKAPKAIAVFGAGSVLGEISVLSDSWMVFAASIFAPETGSDVVAIIASGWLFWANAAESKMGGEEWLFFDTPGISLKGIQSSMPLCHAGFSN